MRALGLLNSSFICSIVPGLQEDWRIEFNPSRRHLIMSDCRPRGTVHGISLQSVTPTTCPLYPGPGKGLARPSSALISSKPRSWQTDCLTACRLRVFASFGSMMGFRVFTKWSKDP